MLKLRELYRDAKRKRLVYIGADNSVYIGINSLLLIIRTEQFAGLYNAAKSCAGNASECNQNRQDTVTVSVSDLGRFLNKEEIIVLKGMTECALNSGKLTSTVANNAESPTVTIKRLPSQKPHSFIRRRDVFYAQQALDLMQKNEFAQNFTIACLAKNIGTNETTLKQAFKKITGTTIFSYWQNKRMKFAAALLSEGHDVSSIAKKVGYSAVSHFSLAFKRIYGIPPSLYNKSVYEMKLAENGC